MLQNGISKELLANEHRPRPDLMWREILALTWPAFVELVMSTLFGMVDMIMVGRLGPAAIASVGLTNQPFMLLLARSEERRVG